MSTTTTQVFTNASTNTVPLPLGDGSIAAMHSAYQKKRDREVDRILRQLPEDEQTATMQAELQTLLDTHFRLRHALEIDELVEIAQQGEIAVSAEYKQLARQQFFSSKKRRAINEAAKKRREPDFAQAFFGDDERIYFDLPAHVSGTQRRIEDWLNRQGYAYDQIYYQANRVRDNKGQERSIGKLLRAAGEDRHLQAFQRDASREADGLKIVLSRNKDDIARMSTNRGWWSCMAADGGKSDLLPYEIRAGSYIAYLVRKSDPGINDPLARAVLKPYEDNAGNIVTYRPDRTYGLGNDAFRKQLDNICRAWLSQPNYDDIARINRDVYRDDVPDRTLCLSGEPSQATISKFSTHPDRGIREIFAQEAPRLAYQILSKLAGDEALYVRACIAGRDDLPVDLLHDLAQDKELHVRVCIAERNDLPEDVLHKLARDEALYVRARIAERDDLPGNVRHKLARDEALYVRSLCQAQQPSR